MQSVRKSQTKPCHQNTERKSLPQRETQSQCLSLDISCHSQGKTVHSINQNLISVLKNVPRSSLLHGLSQPIFCSLGLGRCRRPEHLQAHQHTAHSTLLGASVTNTAPLPVRMTLPGSPAVSYSKNRPPDTPDW